MTKDGEEKVSETTINVDRNGIYTAVTENEFLVVDGIVASPFALAHGIAHSFFDREDVSEWCKDNSHVVNAAQDKEVMEILQENRRLASKSDSKDTGCVELMSILFENCKLVTQTQIYLVTSSCTLKLSRSLPLIDKDEGVGWGTNGFGYRNFKTIRGKENSKITLPQRLSGFYA